LAAHYSTALINLVIDGDSSMVKGAVVSANYFPMLGSGEPERVAMGKHCNPLRLSRSS
jgi:hypothetical protein